MTGSGDLVQTLVDTKTSSTGVAIHTYQRAGAIQYGSFAVDEVGETSAL